jgi:microcystin-dependent protein
MPGAAIENLSISAAEIAAGAVTTAKIASGAVTAANIAGNTITVAELATALQQLLVPVGTILAFGGSSTAPTGWLFCDGTAISRTTYNGLFTAIGVNFGQGNGSTTFNIPDLRGRAPIGAGNDATAANNQTRNIGSKGGDWRLQAHQHYTTVSGSGTTNPVGDHTHGYSAPLTGKSVRQGTGTFTGAMEAQIDGGGTGGGGAHSHTFGVTSGGWSDGHSRASTGNTDSENMPPFQVVNYIIKH